jgi:hypothetical protein
MIEGATTSGVARKALMAGDRPKETFGNEVDVQHEKPTRVQSSNHDGVPQLAMAWKSGASLLNRRAPHWEEAIIKLKGSPSTLPVRSTPSRGHSVLQFHSQSAEVRTQLGHKT